MTCHAHQISHMVAEPFRSMAAAEIAESLQRLIDRLQTEMSHVSYCDEETSMAAEKEDLEDDTAKHSSLLETAVPNSTESVNEGHPDKICDQFSDAVPDACLTCDTKCKVAKETCVKDNMFMVTGEITVTGKHETVARGFIPRQTDQVIDVPCCIGLSSSTVTGHGADS